MELEGQVAAIRERGFGIAALSYDSVELLREFATRRRISYPLLSDPDSAIIERFGLLNPEYAPGSTAHGVPYPVTFVVDAEGVIRDRFFEKSYTDRRTAASFLALAGEPTTGSVSEVRTRPFRLRSSSSDEAVRPGNRVTLALDFQVEPGFHVYAPGALEYRALALHLDAHPLVASVHEPVYPASRPYFFEPLEETVPVFEGTFRLLRDITLGDGRAFAELLQSPEPELVLSGRLEYQACSERVCYPPAAQPLSWKLGVLPLDRERAPEALRRQPTRP